MASVYTYTPVPGTLIDLEKYKMTVKEFTIIASKREAVIKFLKENYPEEFI